MNPGQTESYIGAERAGPPTDWIETKHIGPHRHLHCKVCGGIIDDNSDGGCIAPCPGAIYRTAITKATRPQAR